jgi:hypothetical protein
MQPISPNYKPDRDFVDPFLAKASLRYGIGLQLSKKKAAC